MNAVEILEKTRINLSDAINDSRNADPFADWSVADALFVSTIK